MQGPPAQAHGSTRAIVAPPPQEEWRGEVVHLSWSPRAFLLKGFLSDEECDHLINTVGNGWVGVCLPWGGEER